MSAEDDTARDELLLHDREEWAALALGWAEYVQAGIEINSEWEAFSEFSDRMVANEWFDEARRRLKRQGNWPFDDNER